MRSTTRFWPKRSSSPRLRSGRWTRPLRFLFKRPQILRNVVANHIANNREKNTKLSRECELLMRVLVGLSRRVADLGEQKAAAVRGANVLAGALGAARDQLRGLAVLAGAEEERSGEPQNRSHYSHALRLRKSVIAVLAANRLMHLKKTRVLRYGVSRFGFECSGIFSVLPSSQFREDALLQLSERIAGEIPAGPTSAAEECIFVGHIMEELIGGCEAGSDKKPGHDKRFVKGSVTEFLQRGLANIKSNCKDVPRSQEDAERVERALGLIQEVPQVKSELDATARQLADLQAENEAAEKTISELTRKLADCAGVEDKLVAKEQEVSALSAELVSLLSRKHTIELIQAGNGGGECGRYGA